MSLKPPFAKRFIQSLKGSLKKYIKFILGLINVGTAFYIIPVFLVKVVREWEQLCQQSIYLY